MRYVYQPIEELYIVLITNLQSNILQDIDTLRLLSSIVSSIVRTVDERDVLANCFEILSAFDEVLSLGYRENLTLSQVTTFLEMESHEEKIHEIIERNKEIEAAEERKLRAKMLELARNDSKSGPRNLTSFAPSALSSFGSNSGNNAPFKNSSNGYNNNSNTNSSSASELTPEETYYQSKPRVAPPRGKGLQLGKKKTDALNTLRGSISDESAGLMSNAEDINSIHQAPAPSKKPAQAKSQEPANEGIYILIKEEVTAQISRMGEVQSAELKGSLQLQISDPSLTSIQLLVNANGPAGQYRTHPNVDKAAFSQSKTIKVRDPRRPFPGNNQQLSVLRWQAALKTEEEKSAVVPIEFHCWFSTGEDGSINGIVEYELAPGATEALSNVKIQIPLMSANVTVSSDDQTWNQYDDEIEWMIPEIVPGDKSASGSLEWSAEATSEDDFFPMLVSFVYKNPTDTFGKVSIIDVAELEDADTPVSFKQDVVIESLNVTIV